jgi:lipid II:glycine glycyltransferase (peptidoglycan interpeptide bridge formation enzyme)
MGDRVWRLGVYDDDKLVAVCLVIKVHAKRGNFLFIPHGPIFVFGENRTAMSDELSAISSVLKNLARQEKVSFIRISPLLRDTEENKKIFKNLGFRPAPIHMHAETTWTLDLAPSEEELLAGMRKTTRNLIRRATREGVSIKMGASAHDVEIFNDLYRETVLKHSFTPFSLTFLQKQVKILSKDNNILVFTALYNNQPLASAIIVFYGNSAFYHHGASSPTKYPKIPAAYLLQWEAIREAKRRGHKFYNFWGVIPSKKVNGQWSMVNGSKKHPWAGLTLFKTGFGGFETNYLHAQDLPLSWRYWPNWLIETLRRKRRNL